jgi:DHA1 family multidrug resistance protein-like MFS transporter
LENIEDMKLRDMPRDLALVTLTMIIANITSGMFGPFEPLYLETLGASIRQVGIFFTVQTILAILFRVLGGWISDNMGRLPTIAAGGVFGFAAYLGYTLAPTWGWAMLGALFGAIGSSLVAPSFQAFTAESAPEGATGSTFGLVEGLFLTCQIIGPLLGGMLVENYGYPVMMRVALAIFAVATILRIYIARGVPIRTENLKIAHFKKQIGTLGGLVLAGGLVTWLFVVDGLRDASFQIVWPFLPTFVTEVGGQGEAMYGVLMAGMSVVSALAMVPGGMIADRFGERWGIGLGGLLMAAAMAVMLMFTNRVGFIVAFGLFGMAGALASPAFSSLLSKAVPKGSMGVVFGLFWSALGVAAIPMPYLGGLLYDGFGPRVPFWLSTAVIALTVPLALWKLRTPTAVDAPAAAAHAVVPGSAAEAGSANR